MKSCLAYIIFFLISAPLFCSSALVQNEFFVRPARLSDLVAGPLRVGQYVATDRFNVGNKKPEEWQYLTQYNTPAKDNWQGFLPMHF